MCSYSPTARILQAEPEALAQPVPVVPAELVLAELVPEPTLVTEPHREPDLQICMACGSCSATCTAGPYTGMSVRKVILDLQRGKEKEAEALLSGCMLCGKCTMVCPRGINTRHLILSLCRIWGDETKEEGK